MLVPLPLSKDQVAVEEVNDLRVTAGPEFVRVIAPARDRLNKLIAHVGGLPCPARAYASASILKHIGPCRSGPILTASNESDASRESCQPVSR